MTMILFLGEWVVRSSILILAGALLLWLLRVKNPSVRLTAWTAMLAGSLVIPLLTTALPKMPLRVMRSRPSLVVATASTPEPEVILPGTALPNASLHPGRDVATPFDWMRFAAILYVLVTTALLVRLFGGLVLSLRILRRSSPTRIVTEGIEVRESNRVESPVTIGVLRPGILLPVDWRDWDSSKLEAVLAHERSHIRRRDPAVQFVSAIHRALLWISPLSWFLDRSIVRTAELISDDDAVAAIQDRAAYADILLQFVQRGAGRTHYSLGVPMARYDRPEKRIRRILDSTAIPRVVTRWGLAAILALGMPLAYLAAAAIPKSTPRPVAAPAPILLAQAPAATVAVSSPAPAGSTSPPSVPAPDKAQPVTLPEFEVASIKPVVPNIPHMVGAKVYPGGKVVLSTFNLKSLIVTAFGLSYWQISGGDEWIGKDEYDVEANPSDAMRSSIKTLRYTSFGIEDEHLRQMLQALLMDRFQLKFHRETKTGDVYLLKQSGKTLRLRSAADAATGESWERSSAASYGTDSFGSVGYAGDWTIFNTSMPQLAKFASTNIFHVPVLDRTGLSGSFNYRSQPELDPVYGGDQSPSFRGFLEEAGLKLERTTGPIEMFVIDNAEKPSPN